MASSFVEMTRPYFIAELEMPVTLPSSRAVGLASRSGHTSTLSGQIATFLGFRCVPAPVPLKQ
jgi:hypothetical protein